MQAAAPFFFAWHGSASEFHEKMVQAGVCSFWVLVVSVVPLWGACFPSATCLEIGCECWLVVVAVDRRVLYGQNENPRECGCCAYGHVWFVEYCRWMFFCSTRVIHTSPTYGLGRSFHFSRASFTMAGNAICVVCLPTSGFTPSSTAV